MNTQTPLGERGGEAPSPSGHNSRFAAALASEVDEVMVDRLVAGQRPEGYTSWERRAAVAILRRYGLTYRQIAQRLQIHHRQVSRDLGRAA